MWTRFVPRIIGALGLSAEAFEEIEADRHATFQAILVVLAASAATGIGARNAGGDWRDAVVFALLAGASWMAWALLAYQIGRHILPAPTTVTNVGEITRTLGFAAAPGVFCAFVPSSASAGVIYGVTALWILAATIVALRQALDFSGTPRAVGVYVLGWALIVASAVALGVLFGTTVS
jgi:hypothetical protein